MEHVISVLDGVAVQLEEERIEYGSRNAELQSFALMP